MRIGKLIKSLLYLSGIARDRCESCGERAGRRSHWHERRTECAECIDIDRELEAEERLAELDARASEAVRQMVIDDVPRVREITLREGEAAAMHAIAKAAYQARLFGGSALLLDVDDDFDDEPTPMAGHQCRALWASVAHARDQAAHRIPPPGPSPIPPLAPLPALAPLAPMRPFLQPPPPPMTEKRRD